jgi:UDP-N-acetylmuramoyl-tripeptide--D-alanyl-D-alanine ligase
MLEKIYELFLKCTGISTDTRQISDGNLFVALRGPNFNANKFAGMALDNGALAAIIDDKEFEIPGKTILVKDGLLSLQQLAIHHRRQLKIPVIGITGSNGKTTTKELIHAVLSTSFKTFATKGNLNNHIGVPLSLLSIKQEHEIAIIEMGANHIGEIARLSEISQPTHGLITNIGKAHIGLFGGIEGIIRGKSELYDYLIRKKGTIFVNQNQEILMNMSKSMQNPIFYPNSRSYCPCDLLEADPFVQFKTEAGKTVVTQLVGKYNFENIATALCVGKFFDVGADQATEAVASYQPANNRSQIIKKGTNTIILDAYNANPSSMEKAIENLAQSQSKNKVAIVGDMFELGDDEQKEHEALGKLLKDQGIHDAFFCGALMKYAFDALGQGHYAQDKTALIEILKKHSFSQAEILIKASRGMALEDVVEFI